MNLTFNICERFYIVFHVLIRNSFFFLVSSQWDVNGWGSAGLGGKTANIMNPDQTSDLGAVSSGYIMFAI